MKKFVCIFLSLLLLFALAGCGSESETVEVTIPEIADEGEKSPSSEEEEVFPDDVPEVFQPDNVEITFGDIPEDVPDEGAAQEDESVSLPEEEGEVLFAPVESEPEFEEEAMDVIHLVNEEREKQGLAPLEMNAELMECALLRAEEITIEFSHTRTNGESGLDISGLAYAENIAMGTNMDASAAVDAWMNSDGHKANIMNGDYTIIGVGRCEGEDGMYWVQLFGY